jgi:putative integral membrane protein (TIGR02587 family)
MLGRTSHPHKSVWAQETDDLLRGLTGGFLLGTPLVYTMETWFIGQSVSMPHALLFLALSYGINLGFVTFAGFRQEAAGSQRPLTDALEATSLAIVAATVTLALLHQLHFGLPLGTWVGRIAVLTMPVSFGVAVANHLLGGQGTNEPGDGERPNSQAPGQAKAVVLEIGAAFAGALLLSLNIAPTEEIPMLATEVPVLYLPLIILFSLGLSYAIVFEAGFGGQEQRVHSAGPFHRPLTETVLSYITSLAVCLFVLWLFNQFEFGADHDWFEIYTQVVLLGVPASVGAAAGRLAV